MIIRDLDTPLASGLAMTTHSMSSLVALGPAILLMGCRPLTVRSRGCPLQPEGAPPALYLRGTVACADRVSGLEFVALDLSFQPLAGPQAFYRRRAQWGNFQFRIIPRNELSQEVPFIQRGDSKNCFWRPLSLLKLEIMMIRMTSQKKNDGWAGRLGRIGMGR